MNKKEVSNFVYNFFETQVKFKKLQNKFNNLKTNFNNEMEEYFKKENIDKSLTISSDNLNDNESLVINRVQKSNVSFNPDKLEKALGKDLAKQIIIKKYEIIDIDALVSYLKECGIDPKIFKSFLNVSKIVDAAELDKLEELGKINVEQVKGCYEIKHQKPYFTVNVKRGQENGEQKW